MSKIKIIILTLLVLIGSVAHAQVGSGIVNAVGAFSVPSTDVITLKAQIVSCGANQLPLYNGLPVSLTPNQTPLAPFTASNTGSSQSVTFTVPGNDKLICGGQAYSLYAITWYDNGFPLAPTQTFRFVDATTQTLSNLVPVGFIPPTVVNSAGALCPSSLPIFAGFDAHYNIICGTGSAGAAGMPIAGGTFTGPVTFAQTATVTGTLQTLGATQFSFVNGDIEVDQFAGADFCTKVNAAIAYAVAHNRPVVDASHFSGVQACTSNIQPFSAITGVTDYTAMNVAVKLGNVHVTTTYAWEFRNSAFTLTGLSALQTQFEYVGASLGTGAAFYFHAQTSAVTNGIEEVHVEGIFFLVRNSAAKYALYIQDVNRSRFDNVAVWGAAGANAADIESQGNVTTSWYRPKVSQRELANLPAATFPGPYAAVGVTQFGMELNSSTASGNQTTDGTVIDGAWEYVNIGLSLPSANSMAFSAGTSEANSAGINVASPSKYNTFTSLDIEGNSVYDIQEAGTDNRYTNTIALNVTFASTATWDVWDNGQIQVGNFVNSAPLSNGNRIIQAGNINLTPLLWANNINGVPTNMPFSGTSHLWGGIGGMNSQGSGGELDLFTAFIGATQSACFYHNTGGGYVVDNCLGVNSFFSGTNLFNGAVTLTHVSNGIGLQSVSTTGCTITAGAIGNSCLTTITIGVTEPDTAYNPVCSIVGAAVGPVAVGDIVGISTTGFQIRSIAMSAAATGIGTIRCIITHL